MAALETEVRARALAEERARVRAWKQWIDESWTTSPRVVYRWIRGAGDATLQMVRTRRKWMRPSEPPGRQ